MKFGEILKFLRKQHKLTQDELAKILKKSRSTIAGYEINDRLPEQNTLISISKFFNVSLEYLVKVCKNDLEITRSLGYYINDKIKSYTKISSIEELCDLTKIKKTNLLEVINGNRLLTKDELKLLAIYGPFKYIDLINNSIYAQVTYDPFEHISYENDLQLMKFSLILEINFHPINFYDEIINFYNSNKSYDYFSLIEHYVNCTLSAHNISENEKILNSFGFTFMKLNNKQGAIVPLNKKETVLKHIEKTKENTTSPDPITFQEMKEEVDSVFPSLDAEIKFLSDPNVEKIFNYSFDELARQGGYQELLIIAIEKAIKNTLSEIKMHLKNGDLFDGVSSWISKDSPLYEIIKNNVKQK